MIPFIDMDQQSWPSRVSAARAELPKLLGLPDTWSKSDLARALGIKFPTVSRWESGQLAASGPAVRSLDFCYHLANAGFDPRSLRSEGEGYRFTEKWAEKIRAARAALPGLLGEPDSWGHGDLGEALGAGRNTVSRWESGALGLRGPADRTLELCYILAGLGEDPRKIQTVFPRTAGSEAPAPESQEDEPLMVETEAVGRGPRGRRGGASGKLSGGLSIPIVPRRGLESPRVCQLQDDLTREIIALAQGKGLNREQTMVSVNSLMSDVWNSLECRIKEFPTVCTYNRLQPVSRTDEEYD
jgi:DNA-binding transcriptional regulator YiaG